MTLHDEPGVAAAPSSVGDGTMTAIAGYVPVVAYCLARADGTVLAEHRSAEPFVPASTLKLAVLAAACRSLETGSLSLDQLVQAATSWPSDYDGEAFGFTGDEIDPQWPTDGRDLPVRQILEQMITVSSNEATNVVIDLVGRQAIADVLSEAGCQHSVLGRRYGDLRAAKHFGQVSYCSAGDLAALMGGIVSGRLVGQYWTRFMTQLLARQHDAVIGDVVGGLEYPARKRDDDAGAEAEGRPSGEGGGSASSHVTGMTWGSKSGWVDGIRHDVAYIGEPGPDALVLGICTRNFGDHPSAVAAIRAVARALLATALH